MCCSLHKIELFSTHSDVVVLEKQPWMLRIHGYWSKTSTFAIFIIVSYQSWQSTTTLWIKCIVLHLNWSNWYEIINDWMHVIWNFCALFIQAYVVEGLSYMAAALLHQSNPNWLSAVLCMYISTSILIIDIALSIGIDLILYTSLPNVFLYFVKNWIRCHPYIHIYVYIVIVSI